MKSKYKNITDENSAPVKRKFKKKPHPVGNIRIIAGKWGSRKINVIDQEGLRPTTNRIKETVFNWLQPYLPESRVLDVFSGTGSLGLEALSRGADYCHFNELSAAATNMLKQNIESLDALDESKVSSQDAKSLLSMKAVEPMDIIFLDPPFDLDIYQLCFERLEENNWVKDGSLIYCESARRFDIEVPSHWDVLKEKKAGQVCSRLFEVRLKNEQ